MNFNRNFDPRKTKKRKELVERLGAKCPNCQANYSSRVVGELDEEVTLNCTKCGHFWELFYE